MKLDLTLFVKSYLATAMWIATDNVSDLKIDPQAKVKAIADCTKFIDAVKKEFGNELADNLLTVGGNDLPYLAGHCLLLDRDGHGSGFWDKPEYFGGERNVERLSKICKDMGEAYLYAHKGTLYSMY